MGIFGSRYVKVVLVSFQCLLNPIDVLFIGYPDDVIFLGEEANGTCGMVVSGCPLERRQFINVH
jgi:hypothetical protein